MALMTTDIKTYDMQGLKEVLSNLGQPAFRAKQLYEWLYCKHVGSFAEMTNLSLALRSELEENYTLSTPKLVDSQESRDGTRKYVLELADGTLVETVGIPADASRERLTVCFSTQVGCPMECLFCATGKEGFTRNLSIGEIVDQIFFVEEDFGRRVTNVVGMGQGEPFLNYENVIAAMRIMNDKKGLNIGARRMTVSTCGMLDGIRQLANEPEQFGLAISLHSAIQPLRDEIMPHVARQSLKSLRGALIDYIEKTNRRVTFEYLLMDGVNDTQEDLDALVKYCRGLLCHVNLLPMNAIEGSPFSATPQKTIRHWLETLEKCHIEATIRSSRGSDIAGACGQLKNKLA